MIRVDDVKWSIQEANGVFTFLDHGACNLHGYPLETFSGYWQQQQQLVKMLE